MSFRPGLLWPTLNLALVIQCLSRNNIIFFFDFTYHVRYFRVPTVQVQLFQKASFLQVFLPEFFISARFHSRLVSFDLVTVIIFAVHISHNAILLQSIVTSSIFGPNVFNPSTGKRQKRELNLRPDNKISRSKGKKNTRRIVRSQRMMNLTVLATLGVPDYWSLNFTPPDLQHWPARRTVSLRSSSSTIARFNPVWTSLLLVTCP
jgi:hypothetical protein